MDKSRPPVEKLQVVYLKGSTLLLRPAITLITFFPVLLDVSERFLNFLNLFMITCILA